MPHAIQAQADLPEDTTVVDPLDAPNNPNGTELANYEAERETYLNAIDEEAETPPEEVAEESAEAESESDEESPPTEEEEAEPEVKTSMRPRLHDKVDIAIAALAKAEGIGLLEAARRYEQANPKVTETQAQEQAQGDTVQSVTATIQELRAKRKEAQANLEFETAAELDEQLDDLRDKREELRVNEARAQATAEQAKAQEFDAKYSQSERLTVAYYPDATNPESPLVKRMIELDKQMLELGDPLYHSPDKPLVLAKAAASQLGVMMAKPGAAKVKPVSSSPIPPASGSARTTATAPSAKLEDAINKATSLEEYEKLVGRG